MVTFKDTDHYKLHNLYPGQYCVDMAKMGDILEGPLLIHCNSKVGNQVKYELSLLEVLKLAQVVQR